MDKTQKQLFNTYIRKRQIAIDSNGNSWNEFELIYLLSNDYNIKTGLYYNDLIQFIQANPNLFTKLNEVELNSLYKTGSISGILNYNGIIINREILEHIDLDKIYNKDLAAVLFYAPDFINKIDVNRFTNDNIEWILKYKPSLINYFDLSKLNIFNIHNILDARPELKKYFENNG